jgi:uncharacterized protein (DUF111 family)
MRIQGDKHNARQLPVHPTDWGDHATFQHHAGYTVSTWTHRRTGELATPTAAALMRVLTANGGKPSMVGKPPLFTLCGIGVGAGTVDFRKHPNVLRSLLGDALIVNTQYATYLQAGYRRSRLTPNLVIP